MTEDFRIDVENGKYTFIVREVNDGNIEPNPVEIAILRYGEEWIVDGKVIDNKTDFSNNDIFPWKAIHSLLWQYARDRKLVHEDM